jgi:hypothetical protein
MENVNDFDATIFWKLSRRALTGKSTIPMPEMAPCCAKEGSRIERKRVRGFVLHNNCTVRVSVPVCCPKIYRLKYTEI